MREKSPDLGENLIGKLINLTFIDIGSDDYDEDNDDEAID